MRASRWSFGEPLESKRVTFVGTGEKMKMKSQWRGIQWGFLSADDVRRITFVAPKMTYLDLVDLARKTILENALLRNKGNIAATTRALSMSQSGLYFWMTKLNIPRGFGRDPRNPGPGNFRDLYRKTPSR